jgi:iron complex transport system permease protein
VSGATVVAVGPWSVRVHPRPIVVGAVLALLVAVAVVASLGIGEFFVAPGDVVATLLGQGSGAETVIVNRLRLPRVLCGVLVGVALGISGAVFQSVSRNPLGSPDIIGFTTGASTGALLAILVLSADAVGIAFGALAGGVLTALLVYLLAMRDGVSPLRLVLVGIGGAALLQSLNSLLVVRAQIYEAQSAAAWLIGSLAGRGWTNVEILLPVVVVGVVLAALVSRPLALSEFSDDRAAALGSRPNAVRVAAVAVGVLLAAGAVATAGPIQFVALAAPQIARRLTKAAGPNLLVSGLVGAALLVIADLVAREAFQPRQYAVGVLTGVIGGAYLAWLLGREWKAGRA